MQSVSAISREVHLLENEGSKSQNLGGWGCGEGSLPEEPEKVVPEFEQWKVASWSNTRLRRKRGRVVFCQMGPPVAEGGRSVPRVRVPGATWGPGSFPVPAAAGGVEA